MNKIAPRSLCFASNLVLFVVVLAAGSHLSSQIYASPKPDAVVAADGSGDYKTVQEAINKTPQTTSASAPWTILIKPGVYKELVYIQREKRGVRLVGEDALKTVISYNRYANLKGPDGLPIGTFRTPTVQLDADDFVFENLTIENTAGRVGQALAIRVDGDCAVFRNCRFLGYQDTIFINRGRQYFENCYVEGAVDFIFGGATAWFEKCEVLCTAAGYITAASTPKEQSYGYVFSRCRVSGSSPEAKVFLGRPWRMYAATLFMNCELGDCVRAEGWQKWNVASPADSVRYAEFGNTGAGAATAQRVSWSKQLSASEAGVLTPSVVLGTWVKREGAQ